MEFAARSNLSNGPLPQAFEASAYFNSDRTEWALPKSQALAYIDWCEGEGLQVVGFDVWYPTAQGPTVLVTSAGRAVGNAANRRALSDHPGVDETGALVFNIWVDRGTPRPAAG